VISGQGELTASSGKGGICPTRHDDLAVSLHHDRRSLIGQTKVGRHLSAYSEGGVKSAIGIVSRHGKITTCRADSDEADTGNNHLAIRLKRHSISKIVALMEVSFHPASLAKGWIKGAISCLCHLGIPSDQQHNDNGADHETVAA